MQPVALLKKAEKPYKISDAGGLYMLVEPSGSRLWRQAYRFGGKQKLIALGVYPHVSLAAARDANKRILAAGIDPSEKRKADKHAAAVAHLTTFDRIADDWLDDQRSLSGRLDAPKDQRKRSSETIGKLDWSLSLVRPQLGKLDARTLTTAQIVDALDRIGARGQRDTAHRCRATVSRVLARAARRGAIPVNP